MPLDAAKYSTYMSEFVGKAAITSAFPHVIGREVNVLRQMEFPLFAFWVDDIDRDPELGSDGEVGREAIYEVLVATRLTSGQTQHVELGKLQKVIEDLADTFSASAAVDFVVGRWLTDSNAQKGDGDIVWAKSSVTMRFSAPRGAF